MFWKVYNIINNSLRLKNHLNFHICLEGTLNIRKNEPFTATHTLKIFVLSQAPKCFNSTKNSLFKNGDLMTKY